MVLVDERQTITRSTSSLLSRGCGKKPSRSRTILRKKRLEGNDGGDNLKAENLFKPEETLLRKSLEEGMIFESR